MQRSITFMGGIAGGLAGIATNYVFTPLTQCDVISNSLSTITTYPGSVMFAVSSYALQFQNDFVNFFYQNYPGHDQDFHNILMHFNGYERAYEIGWNASSVAFDAFKKIVIDTCVESASTSSYARSAAIGIAAGTSLALMSQRFSLFKAEAIKSIPPHQQQLAAHVEEQPAQQANNYEPVSSSEREKRFSQLTKLTTQDIANFRTECLQALRK